MISSPAAREGKIKSVHAMLNRHKPKWKFLQKKLGEMGQELTDKDFEDISKKEIDEIELV